MAPASVTIVQSQARLLDPHTMSDRRALLGIRWAMHDALVRRDTRGGFRPTLATAWTISDDARTWHFTLRDGVRFHNGSVLSAADVVFSIERVSDPDRGGELGTAGVLAGYLEGVRAEPVDALTVRVVTPVPMADLLDLLVDLPVIPTGTAGQIGAGPYRLEGEAPDRIVMSGHAAHWAGPPAHAGVHWLAVEDLAGRLAALREGEVDLIADLPPGQAGEGFNLVAEAGGACVALLANSAAGVCQDRRVRQALNLAADVPDLIRSAVIGDGEPLNGPLTPLHFGHDPATPPWPHDPAAARALLAEAGYADGLAVTLDVPRTLPDEAPSLAEALQAHWRRAGIETTIRLFEDREAYALMVRDKQIADACVFDSTPLSSWRVLREKLHSGVRGPWWQGYANPEVDRLLDHAAATPDDVARQRIYRRAYRLIREDAPWVFLYRPVYRWAFRPGLVWHTAPAGYAVPGQRSH